MVICPLRWLSVAFVVRIFSGVFSIPVVEEEGVPEADDAGEVFFVGDGDVGSNDGAEAFSADEEREVFVFLGKHLSKVVLQFLLLSNLRLLPVLLLSYYIREIESCHTYARFS